MFNSYYCNDEKQARPISELIQAFETSGTEGLNVACGEELSFTAEEWKAKSDKAKTRDITQLPDRLSWRDHGKLVCRLGYRISE